MLVPWQCSRRFRPKSLKAVDAEENGKEMQTVLSEMSQLMFCLNKPGIYVYCMSCANNYICVHCAEDN